MLTRCRPDVVDPDDIMVAIRNCSAGANGGHEPMATAGLSGFQIGQLASQVKAETTGWQDAL